MPPSEESHSGPNVISASIVSTTNNNNRNSPPVPNNTLMSTVGEGRQNAVPHGSGLFSSCLPINLNIGAFFWSRSAQLAATGQQQPQDANDNYEIALECIEVNFKENYIGGGNQSSVFSGKWNGRIIALKKLNRASEIDIRKLISLDHPNVVKTIGVSTKDIYPCIIMEYCEKGGLFDLLHKEHVGKARFLRWSREIATGMQYLHQLKIIHRDLKSPNILVDKNDCLKICDFGSLYSWDKTYMPSVLMSVAGTSQWMAPEMLKAEPCSEKIDIWAYGVVLWELMIQEIPYKGLISMSIMYGVGSGNLRLHIPKSVPKSYEFLLKLCFAKRPRNRPSFVAILNHLTNLAAEVEPITEDAWKMRKEVWQKEVNDANDKLRMNSQSASDAKQLEQQKAEELVAKRMHELRHAEELSEMYRGKMERVDKLMRELMKSLERLKERERYVGEMHRCGCAPQNSSPHSSHKNSNLPELKSVKIQKRTVTRANARGQKNTTDIYTRGGQHAVLTMEIDVDDFDNNNASLDDELYESDAEEAERLAAGRPFDTSCRTSADQLPNIPAPPPAQHAQERLVDGFSSQQRIHGSPQTANVLTPQHRRLSTSSLSSSCSSASSSDDERQLAPRLRNSYASSSHQNSFEEYASGGGKLGSSRATSARNSMNFAQRQAAMDLRANRNSISHIPDCTDPSDKAQFVCPCCAYEFQRNSVARISGISADSGVASTMDERQMSALTLETNDESCANAQKFSCYGMSTDLYRNQQARWSDGRIHRHQHRAGQCSSVGSSTRPQPHSRFSARRAANSSGGFTRNSPARRLTSASAKRPQSGIASAGCLSSANDSCLVGESIRKTSSNNIRRSHSVHSNSQPKLDAHKVEDNEDEEDERMPHEDLGETPSGSGIFMHSTNPVYQQRRVCEEIIQEMDSSMSSKSNRSPKKSALMEQPSSTMASSLERSLEAGILDGLSDKESKLRAVKSTFSKSHRRCASNPTCILEGIGRIAETSTESDNDPVYC